jgi:hypothetical protein
LGWGRFSRGDSVGEIHNFADATFTSCGRIGHDSEASAARFQ